MLFQNRSEMTGVQEYLEAFGAKLRQPLLRPYRQRKKLPTWGDTCTSGTSLSYQLPVLTGPVPVQEKQHPEGQKPKRRHHVPASAAATNEAWRGEM